VVWLAGNLIHRWWIGMRHRRWQCQIKNKFITEGREPFTVGKGATAILMVHGFADMPSVFSSMASQLAELGFTCRVMRLPGAGEPLAVAARQGVETWLAAIQAEMRDLRLRHNEVWVLGHSMGGGLAALLEITTPGTADGVIMLAPLIKVSGARAPVLSPRLWFRIAEVLLPLSGVVESAFTPQVLTKDGHEIRYLRDRFIPFATYRGLFALIDRLQRHCGELRVPVYAALVADDQIVDTAATQRWLEAGELKRHQIDIFEECGHALPSEERLLPELCNNISNFIVNT